MNLFPEKDPLIENKTLYYIEYKFISIFDLITKILFVVVFLGLFQTTGSSGASYIESLFFYIGFYVKALIGLFLIYRFNSWREKKIRFTDLDRKVCFSAGLFIILLSFYDIFNRYLIELRDIVQPIVKPVLLPITNPILKTLGLGETKTTTPNTTTPSLSPNLLPFNKTQYHDPKIDPNNIL